MSSEEEEDGSYLDKTYKYVGKGFRYMDDVGFPLFTNFFKV